MLKSIRSITLSNRYYNGTESLIWISVNKAVLNACDYIT